tara:strand:- start:48 stop:602 length:555 start_codon:yes stop_codon:yes gene_type:complete
MVFDDDPGEAATQTVVVSTPPSGGGIDMEASVSIMKYGVITILGMIPAFIVMAIGFMVGGAIAGEGLTAMFTGASTGGSLVTVIIGSLIMMAVMLISQIQMLTLPLSYAVADSRDDIARMGYLDTWKTAGQVIVECLPGFGGSMILMILGLAIESSGLIIIGVVLFYVMVIGIIPYIVKKLNTS